MPATVRKQFACRWLIPYQCPSKPAYRTASFTVVTAIGTVTDSGYPIGQVNPMYNRKEYSPCIQESKDKKKCDLKIYTEKKKSYKMSYKKRSLSKIGWYRIPPHHLWTDVVNT